MVEKQLSYVYRFKLEKQIILITTFFPGLVLLVIFSIYFSVTGSGFKYELCIFTLISLFLAITFAYYLKKSKEIFYTNEFLSIRRNNVEYERIPLYFIDRIKRKFYFFYVIYFIKDGENIMKHIYFFISPDPTLLKSKNIKEILLFIKQMKNERI